MNRPTVQRARLVSRHRGVLLHLFAIAIVLTTFFPAAQSAHAASDGCFTIGSTTICPAYPPPDLLYLLGGIYDATPDQAASLKNLEDKAVQNVIAAHGLSSDDAGAVKSWGR